MRKKKKAAILLIALVAAASLFASDGLMAGASLRKITPTSDMYPLTRFGGSFRHAFIGAVEDIYVRVIAVSNAGDEKAAENTALIICYDGQGPDNIGMVSFLEEQTGVSKDHIFMTATHAHSTPSGTGGDLEAMLEMEIRHDSPANEMRDLGTRNNARWSVMVQKQVLEAVREAMASMVPAEVSLGTTESFINVNRDTPYASNLVQNPYDPFGEKVPGTLEGFNGQGFSDKTLTVVEFRERESKKPLAFIIHYAMHNVLLYANDYFNPAFNEAHGVRTATEEDIETGHYDPYNPDNTVLSTKLELNVAYSATYKKHSRSLENGFAADGDTLANSAVHPDIGGLVSKYVEARYPGAVGMWVSGAAGDQNPVFRNTFNIENPYTGEAVEIPIDGGMIEPAVYYAAIQFVDVERAVREIEERDSFSSDAPISFGWGSSMVEPIQELCYSSAGSEGVPYPEIPLYLTVMRLGDITLAGDPYELYNSIGVAMRDNSTLSGAPHENTLVINHVKTRPEEDNGLSYFPDDTAISRNSYHWSKGVKYPEGVISGAWTELLEEVWQAARTI